MIALQELFAFERRFSPEAAWHLAWRKNEGRLTVRITTPEEAQGRTVQGGYWAVPNHLRCADSPDKYHPLYAAAMLEGGTCLHSPARPTEWSLPDITFSTDEWTRRSMTLNGMRMSTEFFKTGSERVLELLRNRLDLHQRDVVQDVLVYQFRRVADIRLEDRETRCLRAESLAAYLGLERAHVEGWLLLPRLNALQLASQLQSGIAGTIKRQLDVPRLVEGQLRLLRPELHKIVVRERTARHLLAASTQLLRDAS